MNVFAVIEDILDFPDTCRSDVIALRLTRNIGFVRAVVVGAEYPHTSGVLYGKLTLPLYQ